MQSVLLHMDPTLGVIITISINREYCPEAGTGHSGSACDNPVWIYVGPNVPEMSNLLPPFGEENSDAL